jgi:hypothetical protein
MEPIDPKELTREQLERAFQEEFDALVALDAQWRKHFASQAESQLKVRPDPPMLESPHGE